MDTERPVLDTDTSVWDAFERIQDFVGESLAVMDASAVKLPFGTGEVSLARANSFSIDLIDAGLPLWGWMAMLAVLALACESFLVGWWKR